MNSVFGHGYMLLRSSSLQQAATGASAQVRSRKTLPRARPGTLSKGSNPGEECPDTQAKAERASTPQNDKQKVVQFKAV